MAFKRTLSVHLRDTDSTGVIYFAEMQRMAQETFEMALAERNISIGYLVEKGSFLLPVVHAEADYLSPIKASDQLEAQLTCIRMGDKSLTLECLFTNLTTSQKCGVVKLILVTVDKSSFTSISLPQEVKDLLKGIGYIESR